MHFFLRFPLCHSDPLPTGADFPIFHPLFTLFTTLFSPPPLPAFTLPSMAPTTRSLQSLIGYPGFCVCRLRFRFDRGDGAFWEKVGEGASPPPWQIPGYPIYPLGGYGLGGFGFAAFRFRKSALNHHPRKGMCGFSHAVSHARIADSGIEYRQNAQITSRDFVQYYILSRHVMSAKIWASQRNDVSN